MAGRVSGVSIAQVVPTPPLVAEVPVLPPRADNSTGLPNTPTSGWNVVSPPAVFTEGWSPAAPTGEPAANIQTSLGARLMGRVFGRGRDRGDEFA